MEDFTKQMKRNDTEEEPAKCPMNVPEVENDLIKGHFFAPAQFIPEITHILVEDALRNVATREDISLAKVARVKGERIDMPALPEQSPTTARIHSISLPTTQEALKQHELLIRERASHIIDYHHALPSITVDFTFEGQRYKGIAYPMKEDE